MLWDELDCEDVISIKMLLKARAEIIDYIEDFQRTLKIAEDTDDVQARQAYQTTLSHLENVLEKCDLFLEACTHEDGEYTWRADVYPSKLISEFHIEEYLETYYADHLANVPDVVRHNINWDDVLQDLLGNGWERVITQLHDVTYYFKTND